MRAGDESAPPSLVRELLRAPNLLSVLRIPLGAVVWVAPSHLAFVLTLVAVAAASDLLDGWLARRMHLQDSGVGAWLDPLCDKAFVVSVLTAVWLSRSPPLWIGLVALTREFIVMPLVALKLVLPHLRAVKLRWEARAFGKATTVAQFALFTAVLLEWNQALAPIGLTAGALGVAAGLQYVQRALRAKAGS